MPCCATVCRAILNRVAWLVVSFLYSFVGKSVASLVFKRRVEGRRQKENDNRSAGAEEGMVGPGLGGGARGGREGHAARRIKRTFKNSVQTNLEIKPATRSGNQGISINNKLFSVNCLPIVWRERRAHDCSFANATRRAGFCMVSLPFETDVVWPGRPFRLRYYVMLRANSHVYMPRRLRCCYHY